MTREFTVFLGMPGYGGMTAGASRGFWRATRLPEERVVRVYRESSLLAANFNALWVSALNQAIRGGGPDYFAMQHADIQPQDWWLDDLIVELEANDLDVLGVVAPIKDDNGLTSVALDRPDKDTWRPMCRLTTDEIRNLPQTFTSHHVGHNLLINTGLWVCRFDPDWAKKVHFTVNDRIVRMTDGSFIAQVEPEDWFFSRICHEIGLQVGVTRKIRLEHIGTFAFPNDRAWGRKFDDQYVTESVLPAGRRVGFSFPADVEGWLSYDEGYALYRLARGKRVMEIGSYCGRSTICMAQSAKCVDAVDMWDGTGTESPRETHAEFRLNLDRYGVKNVMSHDVSVGYPDGPFDLVFIDGAHDEESVRADVDVAMDRLAPGGLIAFHDYRNLPGQHDGRWDYGVTKVVDELLSRGGVMVERNETIAVLEPAAITSEV